MHLGREKLPSLCIVDAQIVKNTDTAENRGYDAGKKVSGIKRHIAVDINGLPISIHVTVAHITDMDGVCEMCTQGKNNLLSIRNMLFDGGYRGEKFSNDIQELLSTKVTVIKRNELHAFKILPKRWIFERSFSWLEKCRRLWKNCERKLATSKQMVALAFLSLVLRRFLNRF